MWMRIRAWWYGKGFGNADRMPRDVREYILRRFLTYAVEPSRTPEERRSFVTTLWTRAMGPDADKISPELVDEMIKVAFELTDGPPTPLPLPPSAAAPSDPPKH